jgi:hypothetical protein
MNWSNKLDLDRINDGDFFTTLHKIAVVGGAMFSGEEGRQKRAARGVVLPASEIPGFYFQ